MAGRLSGKTAIILGASSLGSMGAATAKRFAEEECNLVLSARREKELNTVAEQSGAKAVVSDITNERSLDRLAQAAVDEYGGLDVAINFVGSDASASVDDMTPAQLRQSSELHFVGPVMFMKHMADKMNDGGALITTSSMTAILAPPGYAAYAGAKRGTDHVVRIAAVEYGGRGIRVNAIAPGFTKTAMTAGYFEMENMTQAFLNETPLGRAPTVEDIANTALWLSSDEAFVTGQVIDVSGGQTLRRIPTGAEMGF